MPALKLLELGAIQRLDRYELVAELASGGMATVYLARNAGLGGFQRFVALKRLHPHLASEDEFVEMFLDEARLAAGIHHPNVVGILEVGASEGNFFLVMDYVEGDTLARLLARAASTGSRVPIAIAIRIVLDMLGGLHAAHELRDERNEPLGIVHRDVSPQNVLVGVDGMARITDFGVARAAARISVTRAGQLKGKLAYMAPEQARGRDVDRRADIFAAGTLLWEVLAGRRLFKGEVDAETLHRVLFEPIPHLLDAEPSVPRSLAEVTMRAIEREPAKRWSTAAELADALERAARSERALATTKEVAAYVQQLLGVEIAQQRDTVRSWLAANETSRNHLTELVRVPTAPPPPVGTASATPATSSLSNAVVALPLHRARDAEGAPSRKGTDEETIAERVTTTPPARSRRRSAPWLLGGAAALLVVAALAAPRLRRRPTAPVAVAPAEVAAAAPAVATVAVEPTAPPAATALASSAASAIARAAPPPPPPVAQAAQAVRRPTTTRAPAPDAAARTPRAAASAAAPRGKPAPGPAPEDDMSRNPYR